MGKLAERLADERRTGVYRVEVTDALEEAAGIVGLPIVRVTLRTAADDDLLAGCAKAAAVPGRILLIEGVEALARRDGQSLDPLVTALETAAARHRSRGDSFFAVFLDPGRLLALSPLYDRRRHSSAPVPAEAILDKGEQS